jgi:hypothetical protein
MTFGESTFGKSSDFEYKSHWLWVWSLEMVQRCGEIHMNKGRVGEERKGKETDRCPLTLPPLQSAASQCTKTTRRLPDPL